MKCSPACERNKIAILQVLKKFVFYGCSVFEIGSGTGQHAVYFAKNLPNIYWYTSDLKENHAGINDYISESALDNIYRPIVFDVSENSVSSKFDFIFTANTMHIMSVDNVVTCIKKSSSMLNESGKLVIYGPFKFSGKHTSLSNSEFDQHLKDISTTMGIRDFEDINKYCKDNNLELLDKIDMPANNFILTYQIN